MAYLPVKAMSELVLPANGPVGGDFDTTRKFHAASAASIFPALRPTRASGLGAGVDMVLAGDGAMARDDEVIVPHAATDNTPMAKGSFSNGDTVAMAVPL